MLPFRGIGVEYFIRPVCWVSIFLFYIFYVIVTDFFNFQKFILKFINIFLAL